MGSLLYICQNALGDVITCLPSIYSLRRSWGCRIDVCVNADLIEVFSADPNVERVISAPSSWFDTRTPDVDISEVKLLPDFRDHYEVVIDSMSIPTTARLIELLRPTSAACIGFAESLHVCQHQVPLEIWRTWSDQRRTASDCFADVVRAWRDDYVNTAPILYVSHAARRWADQWLHKVNPDALPLVAINPGAGSPLKCWPLERYLALGRLISDLGYRPVFVFGPKEAVMEAEAKSQISELAALIYSSPDSRIQQVAALLQRCSLCVSNDCAVMHISAAVGTRTLGIFGPTNSKIWFPYQQPWNQVLERDIVCRSICIHGCQEQPCLKDISIHDVFERALLMLPRGTNG